ncbi:imidazole glycerol phosphate synthase subunit HisF [Sulfurisphaera tokodaii]|uniref:Imidazole glycerol phosphate synthase subunit HisF n=2 Tax=Sulfurisphaera tokodaii TaxID=111955 RepID=HIS6_SULTO|nr:imidazole glycerol phosphate synthase subunit HisF [Sulfurisphaera tokodaii]Q970Z0.1 RecName: Full=Imidazole glycerol phosphate synthase subunit HisF; AltName: Full=IGP synthase cyclase subunit; AltName: Full=IGP synthase subunit HisF; AltName: Full=ImGP synthase subunit HisF; Short=IGPS subunit HisF [Sulfurisphaera tokodaii str. 7]BAK54589.1 imidazole glycerol phosphate synthase subunit HisF [Sulfurisphaera tokodaii str. 7]HII73651.1 imidazole glycerol phosphate synthase subunit HisF [Sulfur
MTAKRIIACLDVKNGRVVKGVNFLNLKDKGDPVELASRYEEEGADEIVFLDITATIEGRKALLEVVKNTASVLSIPLTVGGGIRTIEDVSRILGNGADKVSINTAAVENKKIITEASEQFGAQAIVVAIDVKRVNNSFIVFTRSGTYNTGIDAIQWAKEVEKLGAGEILLTSIDKDGTREGYDIELTKEVNNSVNIPVIASGGAGKMEHFYEVLKVADAALAAGVFHDGVIKIPELKRFLLEKGIEVRV